MRKFWKIRNLTFCSIPAWFVYLMKNLSPLKKKGKAQGGIITVGVDIISFVKIIDKYHEDIVTGHNYEKWIDLGKKNPPQKEKKTVKNEIRNEWAKRRETGIWRWKLRARIYQISFFLCLSLTQATMKSFTKFFKGK